MFVDELKLEIELVEEYLNKLKSVYLCMNRIGRDAISKDLKTQQAESFDYTPLDENFNKEYTSVSVFAKWITDVLLLYYNDGATAKQINAKIEEIHSGDFMLRDLENIDSNSHVRWKYSCKLARRRLQRSSHIIKSDEGLYILGQKPYIE